jgi:hypothetical protein
MRNPQENTHSQAPPNTKAAIGFITIATSTNGKTGNVPQIAIGVTREESIQSCRDVGCPLLHRKHGGQGGQPGDVSREEARIAHLVNPVCYSQSGPGAIAHASSVRKAERCKATPQTTIGILGLINALKQAVRTARIVRLGSIGDPAALSSYDLRSIFSTVESKGMRVIGYTHGWQTRKDEPSVEFLKRRVMASCDTLEQADEAVRMGWQVAVTLPSTTPIGARPKTPGGLPVVICPAMSAKARYKVLARRKDVGLLTPEEEKMMINIPDVTCNTCLLCSGDKRDIIGFPLHDNTQQNTAWRD